MRKIGVAVLVLAGLVASARAQMTVDVAKITCAQFRNYSITDPANIALWLSGYFNGQRGNTVVDVQAFRSNLETIKDYCITRPDMTVMQAVKEALLPPAK